MVKEKFLILFFMFNQIIPMHFSQDMAETDNPFTEVELFHERIFSYWVSDCYSFSCWDIVTKHHKCWSDNSPVGFLNPVELTNEETCEITSCAWLGLTEACISVRKFTEFQSWIRSETLSVTSPNAHTPIKWVNAIRDSLTYRYGQMDHCSTEEGFIQHGEFGISETWWNSCNCHCVRKHWRVYLGELRSRENDNYVVVNVRFQVKDEILYLQPAEGRLEANGRISEVSWIPLPDNPGVATHRLNLNFRTFFLNDVRLRSNYVITGVKFEFIKSLPQNIRGFSIAVSGLPFDDNTGELDLSAFKREYSRTSQCIDRQPLLFVRKNPIVEDGQNPYERSQRQHNYITLEQSELSSDVGQSTLPLFFNYRIHRYSALSGIEIFHKGSQDNSGFFALELFPIDLE